MPFNHLLLIELSILVNVLFWLRDLTEKSIYAKQGYFLTKDLGDIERLYPVKKTTMKWWLLLGK